MRNRTKLLLTAAVLFLGCSASGEHAGNQPSPDQIGPNDNPNNLIPNASPLLSDNISAADVGQTFGVDDSHIPYPDTYWPFTDEGSDAKWNGSDATPVEKFMATTNPSHVQDAKTWEHDNHGPAVPDVASWWGHCPGWTGAAMSNPPIQHPVYAASDGNGGITSCAPGSSGCTKFEIGDINALEAEIWVDGSNNFIGARCDTSANSIQRDANGRIVRNGGGCQGLNAGALVIVLGNRMKMQHMAMAIDAQNAFNTDQIWNQPAYRYQVYRYDMLTTAEAANLVASGTRTGDQTSYSWNTNAKGFVFVDIGIKWVHEQGPNTTVVNGADSTNETRFVAVIELDSTNTDPAANIIGGEYLDDSTAGANRLQVPPFVWISTDAGPDNLAPNVGGDSHNPWIQSSLVKQLINLGTSPEATPPGGNPSGDDAGVSGNDASSSNPNGDDAGAPTCDGLPDGAYCGNDGVTNGDPSTLYQCSGGIVTDSEACGNGCQSGAGNDAAVGDTCN